MPTQRTVRANEENLGDWREIRQSKAKVLECWGANQARIDTLIIVSSASENPSWQPEYFDFSVLEPKINNRKFCSTWRKLTAEQGRVEVT